MYALRWQEDDVVYKTAVERKRHGANEKHYAKQLSDLQSFGKPLINPRMPRIAAVAEYDGISELFYPHYTITSSFASYQSCSRNKP